MSALASPILERGRIHPGARGLQLLAKQAVDSLEKGLIELLTNADESYTRLENRGGTVSGRIEIFLDRHTRTKPTTLEVVDYAEGLDDEDMRQCIAKYGEDTSRGGGRGVFGMGLKDTLIAFGDGEVVSFKNGQKWECSVGSNGDYEIKGPKRITSVDRQTFPNHTGGTSVRARIKPGHLPIGQFETLKADLQTHVCLRTILSDARRAVILKNKREALGERLSYCPPDGSLVRETLLNVAGFPNSNALLKVYLADGDEPLTQSGSCRTGGIVVRSFRACHEATLFGLDEDPYGAKLFGELRCDKLDELQRAGEQVVTKNRDGLRKQHSFTRALFKAAKAIVEEIITGEKNKAEIQQRVLETEETKRRFKQAVKSLNEIASKELAGAPGAGTGRDGRLPPDGVRVPLDGFEFIPDSYRVVIAGREVLKLRIQLNDDMQIGDVITVESNTDGVKILNPELPVPVERYEDPPIAIARITVEGIKPNAEAWISAKCNGKEANATVDVVSKRPERDAATGGLFKEIRYRVNNDSPLRAHFERHTGVIWINTAERSVQLYFDADGAGQEKPANQCLVAELVTQIACEEIARASREKGRLNIPAGVKELDAFYAYLNRLRIQNAGLIHKLLVDSKYRRS